MGRENAVSIAPPAGTRTRPVVGKGLGGGGGRAGAAAPPALAVRRLAPSFQSAPGTGQGMPVAFA